MSFRAKMLLLFGATLAALLLVLQLVMSSVVGRSFAQLEDREVRKNVARVLAALAGRVGALDQVVADWAFWDDTYKFVADHNEAYIDSNLTSSSLSNLALDAILYADGTGRLVHGTAYDVEGEELFPLGPDWGAPLPRLAAATRVGEDSSAKGVLVLAERLELVAARPILHSDRSGPSNGTLVMSRALDEAEITRLAETTHVALTIHRMAGPGAPADLARARDALSLERPVAVRILDDDHVAGYALVPDVYGQPALILRVEMPREIFGHGRVVARYLVYGLLVSGVVIALLGVLLLHRGLGRVIAVMKDVETVGRSGDPSQRVRPRGRDEVGRLAESVNRMLDALEQTQRHLRESEESHLRQLESRVRERTSELVQSNRALEETAREMERARDEADQASKAKSEFLSRMSHELRTPLNAILGFGQLLQGESLTAEQRQNVEDIVKAGRHLLQLVVEVLDIARIETGRIQAATAAVGVGEVLAEALDLIRPTAERLGAKVSVEDPTAFSVYVQADRRRLEQVLLNLLSNAVKYGGRAAKITLACHAGHTGRVRISVSDTGPGIPADKLDRLFVPFERLAAEHSRIEGIGLGLALSKRFAEAMGGTMGVVSEVGRGSTFWVELPRAEPPPEQASPARERRPSLPPVFPPTARPVRTVLYIEDDPSSRRLIERMLDLRSDVRLICAMSGANGLELAREHRPAVVLLDLQLPDIPGREVLRRLRDDPVTRDIPIVVVSSDASASSIDELRAAGVADYVTKPVNLDQLRTLLTRLLSDGDG